MEEVQQNISKIVNINDETMKKLVEKLEAQGVQSVDDLLEVTTEDLTPEVLLPVMARKLIRAWSSQMCMPGPSPQLVKFTLPNKIQVLHLHIHLALLPAALPVTLTGSARLTYRHLLQK